MRLKRLGRPDTPVIAMSPERGSWEPSGYPNRITRLVWD